jgi:hypothetical protein
MSFQKEIEQYLEQIYVLGEAFRKVQDADTLPLSFFSTSIDILNRLKTGIYELESAQLQIMTEHLKGREENENLNDVEPVVQKDCHSELNAESSVQKDCHSALDAESPDNYSEVKPITPVFSESHSFLGDTIAKKIYTDLSKSISLNQRFMFQRDLFKMNTEEMNKVFTQLNTFQSSEDALDYLNESFSIPWESDSGLVFKELLDKHFS